MLKDDNMQEQKHNLIVKQLRPELVLKHNDQKIIEGWIYMVWKIPRKCSECDR